MIRFHRMDYSIFIVILLLGMILQACEWKKPRRKYSQKKEKSKIQSAMQATQSNSSISSNQVISNQTTSNDVISNRDSSNRDSTTQLHSSVSSKTSKVLTKNKEAVTQSSISVDSKQDSVIQKLDTSNPKSKKPNTPTVSKLTTSPKDVSPSVHTQTASKQHKPSSPNTDDQQQDYLLIIDPEGDHEIHLKQLLLTDKVIRRTPRKHGRTFYLSEKRVRVFLNVRNFEGNQKIKVLWKYKGTVYYKKWLRVQNSPRWRTWSTLELKDHRRKLGWWNVEIHSRRKLLGRIHFQLKKDLENKESKD